MLPRYEKNISSIILNAERIIANISSYNDYLPVESVLSVQDLCEHVNNCKSSNAAASLLLNDWQASIRNRRIFIYNGPDSVKRIADSLSIYVKKEFKKNSIEAIAVSEILILIRALSSSRDIPNPITKQSLKQESAYSQIAKAFAELVSIIAWQVNPPALNQVGVSMRDLEAKKEELNEMNEHFSKLYQSITEQNEIRRELHLSLSDKLRRTKLAVMKQYGRESVQYEQIRDISI